MKAKKEEIQNQVHGRKKGIKSAREAARTLPLLFCGQIPWSL